MQQRKEERCAGGILLLRGLCLGVDLIQSVIVWHFEESRWGRRTRAARVLMGGKRRQQLKLAEESMRDARAADAMASEPEAKISSCA